MVKLLGIPFDANSSFLRGPAHAPARIRLMDAEGSANRFSESGLNITPGDAYEDLGDLSFANENSRDAFLQIKESATSAISDGARLLSLGGDHSVSYPLISAVAEQFPSLHILHFDAHADLYEDFDSNPYSHASPFARIMESCDIGSLTQVGLRTLNTHQREQITRYGIQAIEMKDLNLDFLQGLSDPLYISLDLDVLDPAFAPGVSHHEPGGLSTRQLLDMLQQIKGRVLAADIVEYNPMRDLNNATAMVAYKLMKELIGKML